MSAGAAAPSGTGDRRGGRSVAGILFGSAIGQGAVLLSTPFFARFYEPADFGALAIVTSVTAVLGSIITVSWERGVVSARSARLADSLAVLALVSALVLCGVIAGLSLAFRATLDRWFDTSIFSDLWWTLPVCSLALAVQRIVAAGLTRARNHGSIACRNATQGLVQVAATAALMPIGGPLGLVIAPAVGRFAGALGARLRTGPASTKAGARTTGRLSAGRSAPTWRSIRVAARRYRRYPLVSTWSSALNSLGIQLPVILMSTLFGSIEVGFVALAMRLVASPAGLVAEGIGQFFDGALGGRIRRREAGSHRMTVRLVVQLGGVAAGSAIAVAVSAPFVVPSVFGSDWIGATPIVQIVVFQAAAQLVASPISRALILLEKQPLQLTWDAGRFVATNGVLLTAAAMGAGLEASLVLVSCVSALSYAVLVALVLTAVRRHDEAPSIRGSALSAF
ncbi:hypothetical protein AX769_02355 [Frondihabitans sp. PAMC 28766]|uniref:lipopolysaccharide biosynthesis protein n=1 Tax=Frondihabitans sp. PAMC 28766 TaxID=1795630 RepID=UPI00078D964E|nr:hypothetical protein [Frondihabitans sp. PAMC 28766]AMM19183.1 hypothetical protein AX769_02355 [Frondihabitans sp. PAMC 28766]